MSARVGAFANTLSATRMAAVSARKLKGWSELSVKVSVLPCAVRNHVFWNAAFLQRILHFEELLCIACEFEDSNAHPMAMTGVGQAAKTFDTGASARRVR